ncbi:MAG: peptidoglycan DD-metalloendopeptidase family protein, partial [Chitinophagaceae bacterium]
MILNVTEMLMSTADEIVEMIRNYRSGFSPVVPFNVKDDRLLVMDFTEKNKALSQEVLADTDRFSRYVDGLLSDREARYGIGGYAEHRGIYKRSNVFDGEALAEPRRLHLGVDIWGPAHVPVYAPLAATVHSFAYNSAFGDYGATLILQHELKGFVFHTLYGHLSLESIEDKTEGVHIERGGLIAHFGEPAENGNWPPHLH